MKSLLIAALLAVPVLVVGAQTLPPTYLSGIVAYDVNGRYASIHTSTARYVSCREALEDTASALAKAAEYAPKGAHSEGLCIPIHTYNILDVPYMQKEPE